MVRATRYPDCAALHPGYGIRDVMAEYLRYLLLKYLHIMDFRLHHPLLGEIYCYAGEFRAGTSSQPAI